MAVSIDRLFCPHSARYNRGEVPAKSPTRGIYRFYARAGVLPPTEVTTGRRRHVDPVGVGNSIVVLFRL